MPAHRKQYDEAVAMYQSGLSIQEVADYFSVTRQAMHAILKRRGVSFRPQQRFGKSNHFHRGGIRSDRRAQRICEQAILKGILRRSDRCEQCQIPEKTFRDGRSSIQAHHDDYNRPLDVRWLCQKCHHEWHKKNRAIPLSTD